MLNVGALNVPTEPITIPATFWGFLRIVAAALSVLESPVPVAPGPFPLTPLLKTTPPSTAVPAVADWAWAKTDVVVELVRAETGMRV
jgi:hypothetical protein